MSRDSKLALIIGFVVFLTAAVLISDHFSRSREARIEAGVAVANAVPAAPEPLRLREPLRLAVNTPSPGRPAPGGAGNAEPAANERPMENPSANRASDRASDRAIDGVNAGGVAGPLASEPTPTPTPTLASLTERVDDAPLVITQRSARGFTVPVLMARSESREQPRASTRERAEHRVRAGETLYQIAADLLGDGSRWREIRDANPGKVGEDGGVRVGVRLRIPGDPGRRSPGPAALASASPPATYRVRPGDTLSEIAARTLGSARRAGEILALNRGVLRDADTIRVGMELRLPAS